MNPVDELVGLYTVVGGEKGGEPIPTGRLAGTTARFTGDTVTVVDGTDQESYAATYEVDPKVTPWRIVMTATKGPSTGQMASGLVERDGETLRLIYSLPGTQPPIEFKTRPGQMLFVMQKSGK